MVSLQGVAPLVTVDGRILDEWTVTTPLTIRHGRESVSSQAEANTCSFGIYGLLPPEVRMNAPLTITLAWGKGGYWDDIWDDLWSDTQVPEGDDPTDSKLRFTGRITDLNPTSNGGVLSVEVVASGFMADLGRIKTGTAREGDWPEESEDARLQRHAGTAAQSGVDVVGTGKTWLMCVRVQADGGVYSVLDALYETATAGGLVHESIDGVTMFDAIDSRLTTDPSLWLYPNDLEDSVGWSQQIDAFIKRAIVRYGTPAAGNNEQPQVEVGAKGWGKPEAVVSTYLKNSADATDLANLILSRWGDMDAFEAPVLNVLLSYVSEDTWETCMGIAFGDVVVTEGVTPTPAPLPTPGETAWYVEGWSEEFDRAGNGPIKHRLALSVSDRKRFSGILGAPSKIVPWGWPPDFWRPTGTLPYGNTANREFSGRVQPKTGGTSAGGGVVTVWNGNEEIARYDNPLGGGGGVTGWVPWDAFPPGEVTPYVTYSGWSPDWQPSSASTEPVTFDPPADGVPWITCTTTPSVVHAGQPVDFAVGYGVTNRPADGTLTFQIQDLVTLEWTDIDTVPVPDVAPGKFRFRWWATPDAAGEPRSVKVRAKYDPNADGVASFLSNGHIIKVQVKRTRTLTYDSTWWGSYMGNGTYESTRTKLQHGYESGHGNKKSMFGFDTNATMVAEWAGWQITKVELYVRNNTWNGRSTGTMRVGSHVSYSRPASWPTSGIKLARQTQGSWGVGVGKWLNITSWGKEILTGKIQGFTLGPGKDQSAPYHGNAYTPDNGTSKPVLRVTGTGWESPS